MFLAFKGLHLITMTATIIMYFVRGIMLVQKSPRLDQPFLRMAPFMIDGLLIVSAVGTAIAIGWYPFVDAWVTAKLLGTLVFLGLVHAGFGPRNIRVYGLALLPLAYLAATVVCHDPLACFGAP
jgi:uncharacterized membrane protein SirB2